MSERSSRVTGGEPASSLPSDFQEIRVGYTWKFSEAASAKASSEAADPAPAGHGGVEEVERLRAQVRQLVGALEDVVAQALSGEDYKERVMLMHRRAVAALLRVPDRASAAPGDES